MKLKQKKKLLEKFLISCLVNLVESKLAGELDIEINELISSMT